MKYIKKYINDSLQSIYSHTELKNIQMALCTDVLGFEKMDMYLCKDIKLSETQSKALKSAVERLAKHEPIQYVVGKTFFYGNYFKVKSGVLIPRPETEELVDLILRDNKGAYKLLDVGTGSGCIALSIALKNKEAVVEAWDVSDKALEIAKENNRLLNAGIKIIKQDVLAEIAFKEKELDVLVSNPPYITLKEKTIMEKNVLDWEPELALFVPDNKPLLFYEKIAEIGRKLLKKNGKLYFEINQLYGEETARMLSNMGYVDIQLLKDVFGNNRIISAKNV